MLIVDDDKRKRDALAAVLEDDGHITVKAGDGEVGLALARATLPDLVIADLIMPRMDGYEFCQALRNDPHVSEVPIVVNSIMDDAKVRLLTQKCGIHFFIPLGAKKKDILDIVTAALSEKAASTSLTIEEVTSLLDDVLAELKVLSAKLPHEPG